MQFGKRRESRFGTPAVEKPPSPSKKKMVKNAKGEEVLAPGTIAISTPSINVSGLSRRPSLLSLLLVTDSWPCLPLTRCL